MQKKNRVNNCLIRATGNSVKMNNHVVSHFPAPEYNGLEDLAERIMNPLNVVFLE